MPQEDDAENMLQARHFYSYAPMTNRMGSERKMLVLCWLLPTVAVGLLLACCLRFWAGSAQSEHLVIMFGWWIEPPAYSDSLTLLQL